MKRISSENLPGQVMFVATLGSSAILGSFRGLSEEARTRDFPSPSFDEFGFLGDVS